MFWCLGRRNKRASPRDKTVRQPRWAFSNGSQSNLQGRTSVTSIASFETWEPGRPSMSEVGPAPASLSTRTLPTAAYSQSTTSVAGAQSVLALENGSMRLKLDHATTHATSMPPDYIPYRGPIEPPPVSSPGPASATWSDQPLPTLPRVRDTYVDSDGGPNILGLTLDGDRWVDSAPSTPSLDLESPRAFWRAKGANTDSLISDVRTFDSDHVRSWSDASCATRVSVGVQHTALRARPSIARRVSPVPIDVNQQNQAAPAQSPPPQATDPQGAVKSPEQSRPESTTLIKSPDLPDTDHAVRLWKESIHPIPFRHTLSADLTSSPISAIPPVAETSVRAKRASRSPVVVRQTSGSHGRRPAIPEEYRSPLRDSIVAETRSVASSSHSGSIGSQGGRNVAANTNALTLAQARSSVYQSSPTPKSNTPRHGHKHTATASISDLDQLEDTVAQPHPRPLRQRYDSVGSQSSWNSSGSGLSFRPLLSMTQQPGQGRATPGVFAVGDDESSSSDHGCGDAPSRIETTPRASTITTVMTPTSTGPGSSPPADTDVFVLETPPLMAGGLEVEVADGDGDFDDVEIDLTDTPSKAAMLMDSPIPSLASLTTTESSPRSEASSGIKARGIPSSRMRTQSKSKPTPKAAAISSRAQASTAIPRLAGQHLARSRSISSSNPKAPSRQPVPKSSLPTIRPAPGATGPSTPPTRMRTSSKPGVPATARTHTSNMSTTRIPKMKPGAPRRPIAT